MSDTSCVCDGYSGRLLNGEEKTVWPTKMLTLFGSASITINRYERSFIQRIQPPLVAFSAIHILRVEKVEHDPRDTALGFICLSLHPAAILPGTSLLISA